MDRREREHARMRKYRDLARQLEAIVHELEGDRGASALRDAAEELRSQAAAIVRRLDR